MENDSSDEVVDAEVLSCVTEVQEEQFDSDPQAQISTMELQLMDQRDQFLFEYEQLEDEVLELRNVIGTMQHTIDDANRRWAQERDLKLQLERQLIESESMHPGSQQQLGQTAYESEELCTHSDDYASAIQPSTPSATEAYEDRRQTSSSTAHGSIDESPSPASFRSMRVSATTEADLARALEAEIELATLREENRNLITDLVQAKLELATLRAAQEYYDDRPQNSVSDEPGHLKEEQIKEQLQEVTVRAKSGRRWFSGSRSTV